MKRFPLCPAASSMHACPIATPTPTVCTCAQRRPQIRTPVPSSCPHMALLYDVKEPTQHILKGGDLYAISAVAKHLSSLSAALRIKTCSSVPNLAIYVSANTHQH